PVESARDLGALPPLHRAGRARPLYGRRAGVAAAQPLLGRWGAPTHSLGAPRRSRGTPRYSDGSERDGGPELTRTTSHSPLSAEFRGGVERYSLPSTPSRTLH